MDKGCILSYICCTGGPGEERGEEGGPSRKPYNKWEGWALAGQQQAGGGGGVGGRGVFRGGATQSRMTPRDVSDWQSGE